MKDISSPLPFPQVSSGYYDELKNETSAMSSPIFSY